MWCLGSAVCFGSVSVFVPYGVLAGRTAERMRMCSSHFRMPSHRVDCGICFLLLPLAACTLVGGGGRAGERGSVRRGDFFLTDGGRSWLRCYAWSKLRSPRFRSRGYGRLTCRTKILDYFFNRRPRRLDSLDRNGTCDTVGAEKSWVRFPTDASSLHLV